MRGARLLRPWAGWPAWSRRRCEPCAPTWPTPTAAARAAAARALGRLGATDNETIAALLRLYPADPADAPRHAALEALLALGRAADVGMVLVPAGEFLMGSADDDRDAESDEKPQHRIYLPAYYLDRTPVTNAQYRRFIEAGGYANPAYWKEADRRPAAGRMAPTWSIKELGGQAAHSTGLLG